MLSYDVCEDQLVIDSSVKMACQSGRVDGLGWSSDGRTLVSTLPQEQIHRALTAPTSTVLDG